MNLYDMRSEEEWQLLLDDLCKELEMPSALVDPQSFVLQESGERHPLCAAIRAKKDSILGICAQTQKFMVKDAKEKHGPITVACKANMSKCLIPMFIEDEFVGSVVVCGTAIPGKPVTDCKISDVSELTDEEIVEMSKHIPVVDLDKVQEVAERVFDEIHSEG